VFAAYALFIAGSAIAYTDKFSLACVVTSMSLFLMGAINRLYMACNWRWLQFLGAISYSLYLIHNPITGASFRVGIRADRPKYILGGYLVARFFSSLRRIRVGHISGGRETQCPFGAQSQLS
jgi:peptidoglycan/LPS O-acetylase OafA/YrhL